MIGQGDVVTEPVADVWRELRAGLSLIEPPLNGTAVDLKLADGHVLTARYRRPEIEAGRGDLITPLPQDGVWLTEFGHSLSWTNPPLYWRSRSPEPGEGGR